jgi:hypothetical protein
MRFSMKLGLLLILPLMTFLCLCMVTTNKAEAEGGPVNVGYLLDENFSFLFKGPDNLPLASGWDINRSGGSVTYGYNNWMKITDTSTTQNVTMYHKIVTQTSGSVTLEYRIKPSSVIDGLKWQLRNGSTAAVSIATSNSNLVLETSAGSTVLQSYAANTEYGIKVIANIDTDKLDIYINGVLKASNANFTNATTQLNGFLVQTANTSTGDFLFAPVKIYKGYLVNEKFTSLRPGDMPADWVASSNGGVISVVENDSATKPDVYSLKMDGTNGATAIDKFIPSQTDDLVFEFKTLIPTKADGLHFSLDSGTTESLQLTTGSGNFNYVNASGQEVSFYTNYKANLWYALKVKYHRSTGKADIYLNGKLMVQNVALYHTVASVDTVHFYTPPGVNKLMWVDDVMLYKDYSLPADYVPAPTKVSSPSYQIGAQSCTMWREGNHLGWDTVSSDPDRKPYLGFYDEGNPETADWEIKFMVEHGINFENYCWFRPRGNEGLPIKDPYLGYALHDGYFNAKYSDQMKFMITWENASSYASDSADFRNNVIPYWIEYYFKDSRYLKIDNKPVISLYQLSGLIRDFGSLANAQTEINYLRTAVQNAGFSGIYIVTVSSSTDTQKLTDLDTAGFDGVYTYTYGTIESHAELQEQNMVNQKNLGIIDVIPSLSMGRDDMAWSGKPGYWTSTSEFQSLAGWARDTFIPSLSSTSLGKKMIMLDNWNEYGEGHFLMPAGLHGFGYLDGLRTIFTTAGSHTDTQPTLAQKNRINVLYPTDRTVTSVWPPLPPAPPLTSNFSKQWEFNTNGNSEGWSATGQVSGLTVSGGLYSGTTTGVDPGIISATNLGIAADHASYLQIRISSSVEAVAQIYFTTDTDTTLDENKLVKFYFAHNSGNQTVYNIPMYQNANWQGTIRQIRVDMMQSIGSFSIDYIRTMDSSNMVVDPGFEGSTTQYPGSSITQVLTTAQHHTGAKALQITKISAYGSLQIPLNIVKGEAYTYSAWAKLNTGATAGEVLRLGLQYNLNGVQKQVIMMSSPGLDTTSWKQVTGNYTINETGTVTNVVVLIYTDLPAQTDSYFLDDVMVSKVN